MPAPSAQIQSAFFAPVSSLTQRVEIYEADGVTPWLAGANDNRLAEGSVTVDYSRDERRAFDLTLENDDHALEFTPGKFWYDKIFKVYSGTYYYDLTPISTVVTRTNQALNPRALTGTGWSANNTYWTMALNIAAPASHPQGITTVARSTVADAVNAANQVMSIFNFDSMGASGVSRFVGVWVYSPYAGGSATVYLTGNQAGTTSTTSISQNTWTFIKTAAASTGNAILTINKGSATVNGDVAYATGAIAETISPTHFFDGASTDFAGYDYSWTGAANTSTSTEARTVTTPASTRQLWETQIGEFMIDRIDEDHFPFVVKVTGRDYTKKCQLSKFTTATAFVEGTAIETAIKAMAQNAGITKFLLPATGSALGKDYYFERGVSRWEAMKQIAEGFGWELFFDAQGYLCMRQFLDPLTAPLSATLQTGPSVGNLASYSKSVNDTRLYNHIVVTGEASDETIIPVMAEAINTEPSSPTRVSAIGDRLYQYTSSFITTQAQAQGVADKFLKIHALEEYDLNFNAIAMPWLEVGEIIEFLDPRPSAGQPTRFLLSSLTIPLNLGAMTGNAKRVTVVG